MLTDQMESNGLVSVFFGLPQRAEMYTSTAMHTSAAMHQPSHQLNQTETNSRTGNAHQLQMAMSRSQVPIQKNVNHTTPGFDSGASVQQRYPPASRSKATSPSVRNTGKAREPANVRPKRPGALLVVCVFVTLPHTFIVSH